MNLLCYLISQHVINATVASPVALLENDSDSYVVKKVRPFCS